MRKLRICVIALYLTHVMTEDIVSYRGYRVFRVSEKGFTSPKLKSSGSRDWASVLAEHHEYDGEKTPYTVRSYLIPMHREHEFIQVLNAAGAEYNVSSKDLGKEIEEERMSFGTLEKTVEPGVWNVSRKYYTYDEINSFLEEVSKFRNPRNNMPLAIVEPIGRSFEGRKMHLVKISSDHKALKPVILFEAGIHAREWTAISAALYTISQLVANHTCTWNLLNDIDYYIIPLSNPDGYEHSRTKDRLWRKTRSIYEGCYGVDGNRNFDFHWGEKGASSNPMSEIFKGPFPFSEVETRNLRDIGNKYRDRIRIFVTVHAYGPYILYPWSYKVTNPAPQTAIMRRIGLAASTAIRNYRGTKYQVGPSAILMYEAAGGSDDYFKGVLGVDLTFTFELSSAKRSSFIIPSGEIHGIVSEAFQGFQVMAENGAHYHKARPKKKLFISC